MDPAPVADPVLDAPAAGCPVDHRALAAAAVVEAPATSGCPVPHGAAVLATPEPAVSDVGRCPVPHVAALTSACPVPHGAAAVGAPQRSAADHVVRKVLRIKERPPGVTAASAYSSFQKSMAISALRCTLTYVIVPFVFPALVGGVGPLVGVLLGTFALACDTFTIRRFFAVDHKWRWHFATIVFGIMCLLSVLWVQDVVHLVGDLRG